MMQSLRTRLIVGIATSTVLLLVGSGVVVYMLLCRAMTNEVDRSLSSEVHLLIPLVEYDHNGVDLDVGSISEKNHPAVDNLVELWLEDGSVVKRSPALKNHDMKRLPTLSNNLRIQDSWLDDATPVRYAQITFDVSPEDPAYALPPRRVTLGVAHLIAPLYRQLAQLRIVLLVSFTGITLIAILIVMVMVTYTLQPVHRLGLHIAQLDHDNLKQTVDRSNMPSEIVPVVDRFNELLGRLDAAFERERGFTGDVAHELRTPLAGMRSILEVTCSRERSISQYQQALADLHPVLIGMEEMVNKLLMLTRLDAAQILPEFQPVALNDTIHAVWRPMAESSNARQIIFRNDMPDTLQVVTDKNLLQMVLSNLLGNAVAYTPVGGQITLRTATNRQHAKLTIANTGCDLKPDDIEHVCDRFWRGDRARSDTGLHSGLGLSLVQRAMELMRGTFNVRVTDEGSFEATLCLPNLTVQSTA